MEKLLKKVMVKGVVVMVCFMMLFGLLQAPFIGGSWILEHPIQFAGDLLGGFLSGLLPKGDVDAALTKENAIYELASLYANHDNIKVPLQEALDELESKEKTGSALNLTNLALPFMLTKYSSVTKEQALVVANWIYDNCKDALDIDKFADFMLNNDLFKEQLKQEKLNKEMLIAQLKNGNVNGSGNITAGDSELGNTIATTAVSKIGSLYWWGAPGGGFGDGQLLDDPNAYYFDCSGLVAWAHRQSGVKIGRTTAFGYSTMGQEINYSDLQTGDVITFSYDGGQTVSHIGIYIGAGKMVHAEGAGSGTTGNFPNQCVKITPIDASSFFYKYIKNCRRLY